MRIRGSTIGSARIAAVVAGAALTFLMAAGLAARPGSGAARDTGQNAPPLHPQEPQPQPGIVPESEPGSHVTVTPKQRREILEARFKKMKEQADELAKTAQALQADLAKSNSNVLSLGVVEKADKIEKLAKQIKSAAVE